jgi:DNA primase
VRTVKFLFLPTEHDPDSYVRELGAEAFERCVAEAVPLSRQLLETAAEGCDLGSAEGRARLLASARPLWNALPSGLLKRQVLGDLARRAQLPEQELMGLWQMGSPASAEHRPDDGHEPPPVDEHPGSAPQKVWKKKEWKKDWKPGDWKRRNEPVDETIGTPRRQPAAPADHALRMLLLSCDWWERLSPDQQHLLHELPGAQGELVNWLERFLVNHGAAPWSALEEALREDGLLEQASRLTGSLYGEEEPQFEDLQNVLRRLQITQINAEIQAVIANNPDGAGLRRISELRQEIERLRQATAAAAG